MKKLTRILFPVIALLFLSACNSKTSQDAATNTLQVPVEYYKLNNGLKVVLSPDATNPTVAIGVYYNIGFRNEPKERTGFAHLFEHMMFQGSQNLGKMEFISLIEKNGGTLNGSTRFDFTNYYEVVPTHKLETILWAEADRMRGLAITQDNLTNQQGVVKNEVKVNVLNQPYGGFPWLDMPQYANENWYNAHNFYGDLEDLDAANLADVQDFFNKYYTPGNAVLAVVGDFEPTVAKQMIEKYFGSIPSKQPEPQPDVTESEQTAEKRFKKLDKLANQPAVAFAYHMPKRNTPEYFAMGLLNQILVQGSDSKLYQALVKEKGYTSGVSGGINYLGSMYDYNGPMLWMADLIHDSNVSSDSIMTVVDGTIAELLQPNAINQEMLDLALVKVRSSLYDEIGGYYGLGLVNLLCSYALFDDDPTMVNRLESEFRKVTPELLRKTAEKYLRRENRTVLVLEIQKQPS